jgi:hypothetical protein
MNTCAQLTSAISKRIQTLYGKEACQTSTPIACQMQVCRAFRVFNYLIPPCISNRKQNLTFLFQCKLASGQTTSLSSHMFDCLVRDLNYGPWPFTTSTPPQSSFYTIVHNYNLSHEISNISANDTLLTLWPSQQQQ